MKKLSESDIQALIQRSMEQQRIPAVGYCRFSSDHQREESIEAQQRIVSDFAEKNNYEILDWYCDRAFSGRSDQRPEFQRLLNEISDSDCKFSAIIVHKLDRFSRNAGDTIKYKDLLQDYGISLVSTSEKISNDPSGNLLFGILSTINAFYSENLGLEVMKGLRENAYKMQFNGGNAPLGYKIVDKHYVIDEAEAIIVRKIFAMAAEGCSYNNIIHEMNRCGYKTKCGKPFGKNSIYDLLKNPRYKGTYIFNRRAKRTSKNTRNNHKYKPESEQIIIEDGVPAIVSKKLWEKANKTRKYMSRASTRAKHTYLLSGLLYCGECGCSKLHGNYRTNGNKNYTTYRCNNQATRLDCKLHEIRAEYLEEFVINCFCEYFFIPENIDVIADAINCKLREEIDAEREEIKAARYSLTGLQTARNNLVDAIAIHGYSKTLSDKLNDIETQIEIIEKMINEDIDNTTEVTIARSEVIQRIKKLRECLKNPDNVEQSKILLHQYIERIEINNTTVKVVFKTTFSFFVVESEHLDSDNLRPRG